MLFHHWAVTEEVPIKAMLWMNTCVLLLAICKVRDSVTSVFSHSCKVQNKSLTVQLKGIKILYCSVGRKTIGHLMGRYFLKWRVTFLLTHKIKHDGLCIVDLIHHRLHEKIYSFLCGSHPSIKMGKSICEMEQWEQENIYLHRFL